MSQIFMIVKRYSASNATPRNAKSDQILASAWMVTCSASIKKKNLLTY